MEEAEEEETFLFYLEGAKKIGCLVNTLVGPAFVGGCSDIEPKRGLIKRGRTTVCCFTAFRIFERPIKNHKVLLRYVN